MSDKKLSPEMEAFMVDLADVLEKHGASIDSACRFVPYDETSHQVELYCKGYYETETTEVSPCWLRDHVEKN